MSLKLKDFRLFIIKDNSAINITISQDDKVLLQKEMIADTSPIRLTLPIINENQLLTIKINDKQQSIDPSVLVVEKQYKLIMENGQLLQEKINKNDNLTLSFIVKDINNINTNDTSIVSAQQVRQRLFSVEKGTSDYQSASSLRHSIPEVSFSQQQRFTKESVNTTEYNYQIPTLVGSGRSTSFGYGIKQIVPPYVQKNAVDVPSPDAYFLGNASQYKKINKSNLPQCERWKVNQSNVLPGPASYDTLQALGASQSAITIGIKYDKLSSFKDSVPGPNSYQVNNNLVEPSRFSKISFGYGQKLNLAKNNQNPGPGAYELPSVFKSNSKIILRSKVLS